MIHLCTLRAEGRESVEARLSTVIRRFPLCAPFFPYYLRLVNRAAAALGMQTVVDERSLLRDGLAGAGILAERDALAKVLTARGLTGKGALIGADEPERHRFRNAWTGAELMELDGEQAVDVGGRIPTGSLDFAFLATSSAPPPLSVELGLWFSRVRPGGLLAGGDAYEHRGSAGDAWREMLDDFFDQRGIAASFSFLDTTGRAWSVTVPEHP